MTHSSDRYSIAWFKLAECVGRRERERALGVYRLLVHSLKDSAVAAQLEADIRASFQDSSAAEAYYRAARLYEQSDRIVYALTAYEQATPFVQGHDHYLKLTQLYDKVGNRQKLLEASQQLIARLLDEQRFSYVQDLIRELPVTGLHKAFLCEQFTLRLLQRNEVYDIHMLNANMTYIVEHYHVYAPDKLSTFMAALRGLDEAAALYAADLLGNDELSAETGGTMQDEKSSPSLHP